MRIVLGLLVALCFTGCKKSNDGGGNPSPTGGPEPANPERLLFTSIDPGTKKFSIVSMNPDGSSRTTLGSGDDVEIDPALSPDGTKIVFIALKKEDSKSDICVMNADGTDRQIILKGEEGRFAMQPAWSPDGKKIAFTVPKDGVLTMDADGSNLKVLGGGMLADWSPDGGRILYTVIGKGGDTTIHVMDADGKNAKDVLKGHAMLGAYSPNGKQIVYVSGDGPRLPLSIFIADADGKNARQITKEEKAADAYPRWSRDGRHIYFSRMTGLDRPPLRATINVMDIDGSNVKELTDGKQMDMLGGQSMTVWLTDPEPTRPPNVRPSPPPRKHPD